MRGLRDVLGSQSLSRAATSFRVLRSTWQKPNITCIRRLASLLKFHSDQVLLCASNTQLLVLRLGVLCREVVSGTGLGVALLSQRSGQIINAAGLLNN